MHCPNCAHENRREAKFCEECGAKLASTCPACGQEVPSTAKFCQECGAGLAGQRPPVAPLQQVAPSLPPAAHTPTHLAEKIRQSKAGLAGERKQVTVLFADLKGSMELLADRDPEEARQLLDPVLE
jgi:hypothetical protein